MILLAAASIVLKVNCLIYRQVTIEGGRWIIVILHPWTLLGCLHGLERRWILDELAVTDQLVVWESNLGAIIH